jgi:hypothetical protein
VHAVLAANELDWLLIFDNVPDALAIRAALPPAGRGRILITSQYPHWLGGWALDIPVLDVDTAARFLLDRTGQVDEGAAADLARELGGLPLALEQAAAYMLASGHAVPTYLDLFLQRRSELLARGDPAGYDRNVATAWDLAFDQLERFTPLAVTLLRLLACCAPELIPVRVLLQPRPGLADQMPPELAALASDVLAMDDAIAALRRFSLISPPLDGAVSVHRLVQATTLAQLSADQHNVWKHAAAALIEAALPAEPEKPLNWPAFAMLLPHAQTAIPPESSAMARIANFLGYSGNYGAARLLQGQIVEGRTGALGTEHRAPSTEHPDTLTARSELAYWTGYAGDAAAARDQFAALVPVFERIQGAEHTETLNARNNLARWTANSGDWAVARDQYAALVPVLERVQGTEHPDTLTARAHLATLTGDAGDSIGARDQYAALLPVLEHVQGAQHLDTLTARGNLAHWTAQAGDVPGARDQYASLMLASEKILGAEHPDTLRARAELAYWTGDAGDAASARDQIAALIPIVEKVLGAEHPTVLIDLANLARWTGQSGDATGARNQYAALIPVYAKVFGAEHPSSLTVRRCVARWTREAGDAGGARNQYAALVLVLERVLGAEHPDTVAARSNLGS